MTILIIEDRGSVAYYMRIGLEEADHIVIETNSIIEAEDIWKTENNSIGCIILDLNMSQEGLKPELQALAQDGVLTGWFWINDIVFSTECGKEMKPRTICYSEYMSRLDESEKADAERAGVRFIAKQGSTSPSKQILDAVTEISKLPNRGHHEAKQA
jgi:CheY-like chemotaxis protein